MAQIVKNLFAMWETQFQSLGQGDPHGEENSNPLGQKCQVGYSLWDCKESDTTERLKKKAQHINLTFLPVHQLEKCLDLYLIVTY